MTDLENLSSVLLGNVYNEKFRGGDFGGCVWDTDGIAPTLKTTAAASQQFIIEVEDDDGSE